MTGRRLFAAAVAFLAGIGCRRAPPAAPAGAARLPKGDVIWLADPGAVADPVLDEEAGRMAAAAVFLPAGTLGTSPGPGAFEFDAPPPRPFGHAPVVLAVSPRGDLAASLVEGDGPSGAALGAACAQSLGRVLRDGSYGRVAGVHLDFPYALRSAPRYAELVRALRRGLPAGTFVSISLKFVPGSEEERKKAAPLLDAADALVAVVFGVGARVDPIATEALRRPWWAGYDTRAYGSRTASGGGNREPVAERLVEPLSGNARLEFENDLSVNDQSISAFSLTARAPVRQEGLALDAGDRVAFRLPVISEMLFQLGSNLAGKKFALGRAVIFGGTSEKERLFDLAAMEDVLLGRALSPRLETLVSAAGRNAVAVDLVNHSHHASIVSRVDNWVEVDLLAHPADVQLGGFDRYEVFDRAGHPVSPGRASVVRLYETLIVPLETVTPARIVVRGALPVPCCRSRLHAVSAAGPEVAGEWTEPPAPTPVPKPATGKAAATRKRG